MRITNEELQVALDAAIDTDGEDARVAAAADEMTAEERRASDDKIKKWADWFHANRMPHEPADL